MADGNLVRQSNVGKGSVVFGPSVYDVPLLPYERELIKTIGITEEEYCKFAAEVRRKGVVRPAEYDHIPDIQNEISTTTLLVNLAISLVLTGVAYLLTPKPKMPEASKRSQLDLGSVNAGNRFTQSRGFDTLNELADYGAPVPIIFGLYYDRKNIITGDVDKIGGMLITPKLVWSRMLSHGTQQSAKLMFVVGEQGVADGTEPDGIEPPSLEGIFLGNNALDAIHEDFFAFYWKQNTTAPVKTRIRFDNRVHGTNGALDSGDPSIFSAPDEDAFTCPNGISESSTDFCHAYSPANNTQFGVYGAIPNGNGYRVNYEVVSNIHDDEDDRKAERNSAFDATLRRIKITGDNNLNIDAQDRDLLRDVRDQNMKGEGRQYSPRMGLFKLIKHSNQGSTTVDNDYPEDTLKAVVNVEEKDKVQFKIDNSVIPENKYKRKINKIQRGENVDDINQTVIAEQLAADDAMQIGERFAIGNTLWKVVDRSKQRYDPDKNNQIITLECIDTSEARRPAIGLVSESRVIKTETRDFISDQAGIGTAFFPLTQVSTGLVRNNRPAVATEIGLRSKVFQRLNGLCAFNTVPTSAKLKDLDKEEVQVRSGTYTGTIKRSSVFRVFVRKAGLDENGNHFVFRPIDHYFVVTGSKPVNKYNFIRFIHPQDLPPTELEYKFVGTSGAELRAFSDEKQLIRLSASNDGKDSKLLGLSDRVGTLGTFGIRVAGTQVTMGQIRVNKEFIREPRTEEISVGTNFPEEVCRNVVLPDTQSGITIAKAIQREANISNNSGHLGKNGAFFHVIFGNCDNSPLPEGGILTLPTRETFSADKWIVVQWIVEKTRLPSTHFARVNNGVEFTWAFKECHVIGSSSGYRVGDTLEFKRGLGATSGASGAYPTDGSNPFVVNNPGGTMTFSGQRHRVTDIDELGAPIGRTQSYYYEIFGNPSNKQVGESKTITRNYSKGSKRLKVKITATVKQQTNHFSGESKGWNHPEEIKVVKDSGTTDDWNEGETFDDSVPITSNNPYRTFFSEAGFRYVIANVEPRTEKIPTGETKFESQSQYADLSFYRGLVQKSNESEPEHSIVYVNEIVPNAEIPEYNNLTLAGLSLKASRNFTSLDQMRCWLNSGLHVKRLHPDKSVYNLDNLAANGKETGPSNLFTDLVFYLLTNQTGGAGALLKMNENDEKPALLNKQDFEDTSLFLHAQKLFFNGVIGDRTNLRQYITDTAPFFLCNFVIMDGKFSLKPAIPVMEKSGQINVGAVKIDQLFTAGNILEGSYKVEYLRSEERRPFKAVMRYRQETKNKLPEEKVIQARLPGQFQKHDIDLLPQEQFDLTQFCTSESHAIQVAKYFLGIRDLVTHTISFSTTVHGLDLQAGSYIKVITSSSPYLSANNGTVSSTGVVESLQDMPDGQYEVFFFKADSQDVEEAIMQVNNGIVSDATFYNTVFSVKNETVSQNVYVVEQLTFSQEGTVDIVASEHPCDDDGSSKLAKLIASENSVITDQS